MCISQVKCFLLLLMLVLPESELMSSANEHLPPPPKPRMSPLEFRNTDLVSRLLAATPPYLYNMSLLPNTYFFSEMLRSFVQAKAERNAQQIHPHVRRSRKRNWTAARPECYLKPSTETKKEEKQEVDWMIKSNKKAEENPLELTTQKQDNAESSNYQAKVENPIIPEQIYPSLHSSLSPDANQQNLVLPPPPPMWYPPLYPAPPYGIDPLHFFIDLRVSGHIYDRKNQRESNGLPVEKLPHTEVAEVKTENENFNIFKQPRHCSAFSVPVPSRKSSEAINLCEKETKSSKFDVKSMGFDKSSNKTSSTYVMSNINSIYKNIHESRIEDLERKEQVEGRVETDEEKEKRVKDLRALIGLELVVDYMKQKPEKHQPSESLSSTDIESVGSPVEVVALLDEN